jgi:hypothetical protein
MKRFLSLRTMIAAVTLTAGLLGLLAALPNTEAFQGVCTYYSGPNYRTAVGARGTGCCGETISWGIITPYRQCGQIYCLDVWCPIYE